MNENNALNKKKASKTLERQHKYFVVPDLGPLKFTKGLSRIRWSRGRFEADDASGLASSQQEIWISNKRYGLVGPKKNKNLQVLFQY